MKAKFILESINKSINENLSHDFSPNELYVVVRSGDAMRGSVHELDTIYADENDARPEAMYRNSQGYKSGEVTRSNEWRVFTIAEIIDMID